MVEPSPNNSAGFNRNKALLEMFTQGQQLCEMATLENRADFAIRGSQMMVGAISAHIEQDDLATLLSLLNQATEAYNAGTAYDGSRPRYHNYMELQNHGLGQAHKVKFLCLQLAKHIGWDGSEKEDVLRSKPR